MGNYTCRCHFHLPPNDLSEFCSFSPRKTKRKFDFTFRQRGKMIRISMDCHPFFLFLLPKSIDWNKENVDSCAKVKMEFKSENMKRTENQLFRDTCRHNSMKRRMSET